MGTENFKKLASLGWLISGIILILISTAMSADGFGIVMKDKKIIGYGLAVMIILVEFGFVDKEAHKSWSILIAGILCYMYGVATNVVGIWAAFGGGEPAEDIGRFIGSVALGFFIEIFAEPFVMKGLGVNPTSLLEHMLGGGARSE